MKLPPFPNLAGLTGLPENAASDLLKAFRESPPVDAAAIGQTIERALASAGLDTHGGAMKALQDNIQRALAGTSASMAGWAAAVPAAPGDSGDSGDVIDVEVREVGGTPPAPPAPAAQFVTRSFRNPAGSRHYKLYLPSGHDRRSEPLPLVVMLHGCTQSPDDFAAGTRMNALAEQHGFLVAYPEQAAKANGSKCWNWFNAKDQQREQGEPSLIAGITHEVMAGHRVDPQRVFVAGLSAGAAMAVILGETYPELFAAIGVHSGLPYAAARDVASAFAAMKGGAAGGGTLPGALPRPAAGLHHAVPTIVFHGDQDHTVALANGQAVVSQALAAWAAQAPLRRSEEAGKSAAGQAWRRGLYSVGGEGGGRPLVEDWLLHGAGHAWSGGSASGSYTDPTGPDASAEMLRFFMAQRGQRAA